jgi:hypothetical protein
MGLAANENYRHAHAFLRAPARVARTTSRVENCQRKLQCVRFDHRSDKSKSRSIRTASISAVIFSCASL